MNLGKETLYGFESQLSKNVETFGRAKILECQVPVRISGELVDTIEVRLGDFIFRDFDGVLVIPKLLVLPVLTG